MGLTLPLIPLQYNRTYILSKADQVSIPDYPIPWMPYHLKSLPAISNKSFYNNALLPIHPQLRRRLQLYRRLQAAPRRELSHLARDRYCLQYLQRQRRRLYPQETRSPGQNHPRTQFAAPQNYHRRRSLGPG